MNRTATGDSGDARASRTKAVQLAFVQSLRNHAIPSDWLECEVLRGATPSGRHGLHVHFVVSQGGPSLLPHAARFEATFTRNLGQLLPDAGRWLLGVAWVLNDSPQEALDPGWAVRSADLHDAAHVS